MYKQKENKLVKIYNISKRREKKQKKSDVRFINLFADPRQSLPLPSQNHNNKLSMCSLCVFYIISQFVKTILCHSAEIFLTLFLSFVSF